jgi:hypothetical protein
MRTYIIDTNVVIKIWKDNPYLFDLLDSSPEMIYRITNDTICELTHGTGEIDHIFPRVTKKYQRLFRHIINNPSTIITDGKENRFIKKDNDEFTVFIGNMVSKEDYSTIFLCQNNPSFTLVTNDKKMLKSGKLVLQKSQLMDYNTFIEELTKIGIVIERNYNETE